MTIHAAKGLEWDVVILPGLGRRTASDSDPLLHWLELPRPGQGRESDLLLCPIRASDLSDRAPARSLSAYIEAHAARSRSASSECVCCMWPRRELNARCTCSVR